LANAYQSAGRTDDAIRLLQDHLELVQQKLGHDHPLTLSFVNNLALAYVAATEYHRAIPLYQSALEARKKKLGNDHPETLVTMNNLANAYSHLGDQSQSIPMFEEVLRRREKVLGRNHPNTQRTVCNLGEDYVVKGRFAEGIPLLEEAAQSLDRHPEMARALSQLRKGYWSANRMEDFKTAVEEHLVLARQRFGENSPKEMADMLESIGVDVLDSGDAARAAEFLSESFELRLTTAPQDWPTFHARLLFGIALLSQSQFPDAASHLAAGFDGLQTHWQSIPPKLSAKVVDHIKQVIELYESTARIDDAQLWRARLNGVLESQ
jgi:tetratricopeptide (TPR) repeat protein